MKRKILHSALWLLIAFWFTVMMGFVNKTHDSLLCRGMLISVSDSSELSFITESAIRELISNAGFFTQGYPIEGIHTRDMEKMLEKDPYVKNAEVYTDVDGDLYVDITQRKPIVRVMPGGRNGYYIDQEGVVLPLSANYSPMVLLLTGHLDEISIQEQNGGYSIDLEKNTDNRLLMEFASYVDSDPFWSKQIVQVYRSKNGEYEIIPRVGAHQIAFGTMEDFKRKLRNLELLYEQGFAKYGWNTYDKINLKYSNQIICTKR
jgi:cell division protein FtsQ